MKDMETSLVGRKVRHRSGGPAMLAIGGCVDGNGKHIDDVMCEFWNGSKWDRKAFHPHFLEVVKDEPQEGVMLPLPKDYVGSDVVYVAIEKIGGMPEQNERRSLIEEMSPKMDAAHAEYLKNHSSKGIMPMLAWEFAPEGATHLVMDIHGAWVWLLDSESDPTITTVGWEFPIEAVGKSKWKSYVGPKIGWSGSWKDSLHKRAAEPQQAEEEWVYLTSVEEIERHREVKVHISYSGGWSQSGYLISEMHWARESLLKPSPDGKPSCIRVRKKDYVGDVGAVEQKVWDRKELLEHINSFFAHPRKYFEIGRNSRYESLHEQGGHVEGVCWYVRGSICPSGSRNTTIQQYLSPSIKVNYTGTDEDSLVTLEGGAE